MRCEARRLLALEVRHLEWMAVRGRPDRLHHVPEVEAAGVERAVAQDRERREPRRVRHDRCEEQAALGTRIRAPFDRCRASAAPSTSSLACSL